MDRVIDQLWEAGFALAELAEATVSGAPVTVALGDQVVTAGRRLWSALDNADEIYCTLARLSSLPPSTSSGR